MPELPEVEIIRRMLDKTVTGKTVTWTEVPLQRIIRRGDLSDLVGGKVVNVKRQGKFLCLEIDTDLRVYVHFRMSGTFHWQDGEDAYPFHVRAVIGFNEGRLLYRDPRTLGGLWIDTTGEPPWRKMGIDALDPVLNQARMKDLFFKRRKSIKEALLDQGLIAGIGNIYASEMLFDSNIDPRRPANELSLNELDKLLNSISRILNAAIDSCGTTFRDFRLSDGREGSFQRFLKVYGKKGESCSVCGNTIERIVQAQRSTFFCSCCQK